ncbi:MAG TPA: sodium/substrate symporter small subunit [Limnobacter sp.]|nr:sodium/substrate symporter small subunit [Limnobacter sp.]
MSNSSPTPLEELYWQRVKRITRRLLAVWVLLILGVVLLVPRLGIEVYGVPLTYWLISSVLLLTFLGLVALYAWQMDRLDAGITEPSAKLSPPAQPGDL